MKRTLTRRIVGALAALPLLLSGAASGEAQEAPRQRWKMTTAFSAAAPLVGVAGKRMAEQIGLLTGGSVEVRFFDAGAIVPPLEVFDAVGKGTIDAGWHAGAYLAGKIPAAQAFTGLPFGPAALEFLAWYEQGGGKQLHEKIYGARKVKPLLCTILAPEAAGWFRKEIKTVEDYKGLKFRIAGLGGKVIEKLGGSSVLIPGPDVKGALERGVIDGTEYSSPAIDISAEYYNVAKLYYFPGWHQQAAGWELLINLDKWKGLSKAQQSQIESACRDNIAQSLAEGEAAQTAALEKIKSSGVQILRLPQPVLDALKTATTEVINEAAAADPEFKEVWDSLSAFRANYAVWGSLRQ